MDNWWEKHENYKTLLGWAEELVRICPNERIFCLGQSPAWLVEAADILSQARGEQLEVGYIPFSGRFTERNGKHGHGLASGRFVPLSGGFDLGGKSSSHANYTLSPYRSIKDKGIYRQYLDSIGLNPMNIIDRMERGGQKTAIIEYTQEGESLASFLYIMHDWAKDLGVKDRLSKALDVVLLVQDFTKLASLSMPNEGWSVSCKRLPVETSLIVPMANGEASGKNSDRRVPSHYPEKWHSMPEPISDQDTLNNQSFIRQEIRRHVDELAFHSVSSLRGEGGTSANAEGANASPKKFSLA